MVAAKKEQPPVLVVSIERKIIPISKLHSSEINPRKTFPDDKDLDSMAVQGLIQPLLVRPSKKPDFYEIVCGERRYRKAKKLGWTELRCEVQALSDQQAREIALVENLSRIDVPPLEEAEAFKVLIDELKVPVEELATRIGKSKPYVLERMKLLALCDEAKLALREDRLRLGAAFWVARLVNHDEQREVLPRIAAGIKGPAQWDRPLEEPASASHAQHLVLRQMRRLDDAPFDLKDAALVPAAGPCTTCVKNTGLQPELFPGQAKKDASCPDGSCWQSKINANNAKKVEEVKKKGLPVVEVKPDAPSIWEESHDGFRLKKAAAVVDLNDRVDWDVMPGNKTWREVLKGSDVEVKTAFDDAGKPHDVANKQKAHARAKEVLKEQEKARKAKTPAAKKAAAANKMPSLKDRVKAAKQRAVLEAVARAAEKKPFVIFRSACLEKLYQGHGAECAGDIVAKRRGLGDVGKLEASIEKSRDTDVLAGILAELEIAAFPQNVSEYEGELGIDAEQLEQNAEEEETEKFSKEKEAAAAKAKPLKPEPVKKAKAKAKKKGGKR